MMKRQLASFAAAWLLLCGTALAGDTKVSSPDGRIVADIHGEKSQLTWSLTFDGAQVLNASEIGINGALKNMKAGKTATTGAYTTTTLSNGKFTVEFKIGNNAVGYRIKTTSRKALKIANETAEFNFAADYDAFVPYVNDNRSGERYCYSFESYYDEQPLSKMFADSLAINPLAVRLPKGKLAVVLDASVVDYPGMFLTKHGAHGLKAAFAPFPLAEVNNGHARLNLIPTQRADYIAEVDSRTIMPWRIVALTDNDTQLLASTIAKDFGPACQLSDTSWIRPGKVAWDWWNNTNLTGVDFKAGMNTDTYKYYIDFAQRNHLEYIIIDEGWSTEESLTENLNREIDLDVLLPYAKERGVGIILWSSWRNSAKDTEQVFKYYANRGVAGFKVDFFDRDDQRVMRSAWQIADCAARNHLLLDFHGFRPTGIQYAYPNIVNFEGVKGLENAKWEPRVGDGPMHDQPRYDVQIPYLRMLVGPLDYTPGAMVNATRDFFFGNNNNPMSQGTRAHQVAMYILYDAPLQMLADSPSKYMKEQETTDFIAQIPTVFDETVGLDGQLGEYAVIAKRKGSKWYVAAMTNWNARDLTIDLSMLSPGNHRAVLFADGFNADRDATDYKRTTATVSKGQRLSVHLAPGGGWTAIIE